MIAIFIAQAVIATPVTHDSARAALATLSAYVEQAAAAPKPVANPLSVTPTLSIPDTVIAPGDRTARVPVMLSEPALRPLTWRCATLNGSAYSPAFYQPVDTRIIFQTGQTRQIIEVPIKRDLGALTLSMNCAWSLHGPVIKGAQGLIRQGPSRSALAAAAEPTYPPVARAGGRRLTFSSTFKEQITPDARAGAWRSRPEWGRVQTGNKEIAPNADATTDPGTNPHPIVDGKRMLRAEYVATKDAGNAYRFSASMIDSANLVTFDYGYVELRVKVDRAQGTVPAFWLLPLKGWPPEIDIFEIGLGDRREDQSTIHIEKKPDVGEGTVMLTDLADGQWHVVGFDITPEWQVTFVDGKEAVRRPNPFPRQPWKVILNVAVGGLTPDPKDAAPGWKSEMTLDYLKIWQ